MGSGAERSNEFSSDSFGGSGIQNSWNPKLNKGPSDFDSRQLVTVDAVYQLPAGRGRSSCAIPLLDALFGGWQLSGLSRGPALCLSRSTSPVGPRIGLKGFGVVTGQVQVKKHLVAGIPQVFAGNTANVINAGINDGVHSTALSGRSRPTQQLPR